MQLIAGAAIPVLIAFIVVWGQIAGVNTFAVFLKGAGDGLKTAVKILPALIGLVTAVEMFKASGALDFLTAMFSPVWNVFGIPSELVPLSLLRPISSSGSIVLFKDILTTHGADSFIGRVASVMQGSAETTFYVIAVYYGVTAVKKTRHTLIASLAATFAGYLASVFAVKLLLS